MTVVSEIGMSFGRACNAATDALALLGSTFQVSARALRDYDLTAMDGKSYLDGSDFIGSRFNRTETVFALTRKGYASWVVKNERPPEKLDCRKFQRRGNHHKVKGADHATGIRAR